MNLPPNVRELLERLDRVCGLMNDWLLVVAFGLFVVDLMFAIAWLAPPTPAVRLQDIATERAQQSGQPAPTYQGVP